MPIAPGFLRSFLPGSNGMGAVVCLVALAPLQAQPCPWRTFVPVAWEDVPDPLGDPALSGGARRDLLAALDASLAWFRTPAARKAYAGQGAGAQERVRRSVAALRDLLASGAEGAPLRRALRERFQPYALRQGPGRFSGYCEIWAEASRTRTDTFRYPLYRLPKDFASWPKPHPTREALEGRDGLQGGKGPLKGLELVWLKSRFDAYLIHVQGSANLRLTDGGTLRVGYAGRTSYPFVAVGELLAKDLAAGGGQPVEGVYARLRSDPQLQEAYLPRNRRFVFFTPTEGVRKGAYGMPLTPFRSFAADARLLPPGALTLLDGGFPGGDAEHPVRLPGVRLALNQDRGGDIQGPGRLDVYTGGGTDAFPMATAMGGPGRTFLLLLRGPEQAVPAP